MAFTTFGIEVQDVSRQKHVGAEVPSDTTVGKLIQDLVDDMGLPPRDSTGRAITYAARLEREGRHLHDDEIAGTALRPGDSIQLQPNIDAGRGR